MEIRPFRGLRHNLERIASLSSVICPPYDVISPDEQQLYHDRSPYNVIRLELAKELPDDSPHDNKYTRAAAQLKDWQEKGILVQEEHPALYIFQHCFTYQGIARRRWGLAAAVLLEDWDTRQVRPHEAIYAKLIQDRLTLLQCCRINTSPIMGLCCQQGETLMKLASLLVRDKPALQATDDYGVTHNMWIVTEEEAISKLSDLFAKGTLYIADGHHRYETALAYQKEQHTAHRGSGGREAFNFVMMTLMDAADPGLLALPVHRLVRLPTPHHLSQLKEKLATLLCMEKLHPTGSSPSETLKNWLGTMEERGRQGKILGVYGLDRKHLHLLSPREESVVQQMLPADRSQPWKELDVSLLQWVILRGLAGMDSPTEETEHLAYTQDALQAIRRVDSGEYQLAFLLNPIPVSSIMAVADTGDRMPHKSTYFYPKPPTGLVMYPLWETL